MKKRLTSICSTLLFGTSLHVFALHPFIWDEVNGRRDLGSLGGDSSATGINDTGTVVGWYAPEGKRFHGFIWTEATGMVDLGIPGGVDNDRTSCNPTAINSAGNVVGYARQGNGKQVAFFWSPAGGFTTLFENNCSCDNGNVAYAINDNDQVTGNLLTNGRGGIYHAFLWAPDMNRPLDLGTVGDTGWSLGYGLNNLGHIVGGSLASGDSTWYPMVWTDGSGMRLLGMLSGATYMQALGINDADAITGYGFTSATTFGFYKTPHGGLHFLEGLGGNEVFAEAINQLGIIAGAADDATSGLHAVIWQTPSSAPQDLGLGAARALNNVGQVVGDF